VLELSDRTGSSIRLSAERWSHISRKHPDVAIEDIRDALLLLSGVRLDSFDRDTKRFSKFRKETKRNKVVVVKYLKDDAFIVTAYIERRP